MLNLSSDLKAAVREKGLGCTQALILNRLSATELGISERQTLKLREQGIKAALVENFSTTQMQQWVSQQKIQYVQAVEASASASRDEQVDQLLTSVQKINLNQTTASVDQLKELEQVLEAALVQIKQQMQQT